LILYSFFVKAVQTFGKRVDSRGAMKNVFSRHFDKLGAWETFVKTVRNVAANGIWLSPANQHYRERNGLEPAGMICLFTECRMKLHVVPVQTERRTVERPLELHPLL
jgi:hypothetical protein